jgi:UDP-2,3-diacylglucosamine pyrophosphatase LpxH
MSDCHRGAGNFADDFASNKLIYFAALENYNRLKYTYIELGDGDELWKNKRMSEIAEVHGDVFQLLEQFCRDGRMHTLYGNHDMVKKNSAGKNAVAGGKKKNGCLEGMTVSEGLILKQEGLDGTFFLLHGHQADLFNDTLWRLTRFLVRHVWKPLELVGFRDPSSAAKNNKVKEKVEMRLTGWAEARHTPVIAGHTHRPVFPEPGEGVYFNDGCCVHPWSITALEIERGALSLVRWGQKTRGDGTVYVGRDIIAGPKPLAAYIK